MNLLFQPLLAYGDRSTPAEGPSKYKTTRSGISDNENVPSNFSHFSLKTEVLHVGTLTSVFLYTAPTKNIKETPLPGNEQVASCCVLVY